jgi:ABC-type oligopeptide transport system ATPase subunit
VADLNVAGNRAGSASRSDVAFRLRDVSQRWARAEMLHDIDLDVPSGQVSALIGPSGAGKTSLLRLLKRLDDHMRGEIAYRQRRITDYVVRELRSRVGYVFHTPVHIRRCVSSEPLLVGIPGCSAPTLWYPPGACSQYAFGTEWLRCCLWISASSRCDFARVVTSATLFSEAVMHRNILLFLLVMLTLPRAPLPIHRPLARMASRSSIWSAATIPNQSVFLHVSQPLLTTARFHKPHLQRPLRSAKGRLAPATSRCARTSGWQRSSIPLRCAPAPSVRRSGCGSAGPDRCPA